MALHEQATGRDWYQAHIRAIDWHTAERGFAVHLGPQLRQAQHTGVLRTWWFIRKAPWWRLRCQPGPAAVPGDVARVMGTILDGLTTAGVIDRWWKTEYEPETYAFGGPAAMDIAHDLFHADSRHILDYLRRQERATRSERPIGRRELSVLLCSAQFRAATQDWYEQGDIWHRVTQLRPLPQGTPVDRLSQLTPAVRRLMSADCEAIGTPFDHNEPLAFAAAWVGAFTTAGRHLGDAATTGTLCRGVRDVLAHHVIFHWNRLGLPARTQAVLARAARDTVMHPDTELLPASTQDIRSQ